MKRQLFILALFFSSCSLGDKKNVTIDSDQKNNDSITYESIKLEELISNPQYKHIYETLNNLSCVKTIFKDSSKFYDTIYLEVTNARILNDSSIKVPKNTFSVRFPKDTLEVSLTGLYNNKSNGLSFYTFKYIYKSDLIITTNWSEIRSKIK